MLVFKAPMTVEPRTIYQHHLAKSAVVFESAELLVSLSRHRKCAGEELKPFHKSSQESKLSPI